MGASLRDQYDITFVHGDGRDCSQARISLENPWISPSKCEIVSSTRPDIFGKGIFLEEIFHSHLMWIRIPSPIHPIFMEHGFFLDHFSLIFWNGLTLDKQRDISWPLVCSSIFNGVTSDSTICSNSAFADKFCRAGCLLVTWTKKLYKCYLLGVLDDLSLCTKL